MKKLLVLLVLAGLAYWLVKDRLGGEPDEFVFTEAPPAGDAETPAEAPPAADAEAPAEAPPAGDAETPPTSPPPTT